MRNHNAFLLCCIIGLLLPHPVSAEEAAELPTTTFSGTLVDADTELPLLGVKLSLVEPGEYFATTGPGGRFTFRDIPNTRYGYMFAYDHGEADLARTTLLFRNVDLAGAAGTNLVFHYKLYSEQPEAKAPDLAPIVFEDGREREYYRPFPVRDTLGMAWSPELITLNLNLAGGTWRWREASLRVVDGGTGREVPFQLSNVKYIESDILASASLTFPITVEPFQNKVYSICGDWREGFPPADYPTDLKTETLESGEQVLSNSLIAVKLPPRAGRRPQPAGDCPAPILALRGPDGAWFGQGRLVSPRTVTSYTCEQMESGPLFTTFLITYTFPEEKGADDDKVLPAGKYEIEVSLEAGRDYVTLTERMQGDIASSFQFSLVPNLAPDVAFFAQNGMPMFEEIGKGPQTIQPMLAAFRAWNPPGLRQSHNWYGLLRTGERKDAVGLVQINGGYWDFAGRDAFENGSWLATEADADAVRLMRTADDLYFDFPHRAGTRTFALVAFDKNRNWDPATLASGEPNTARSHYLDQLHLRLSQVNLNGLVEARLDKAARHEGPWLLFSPQAYASLKTAYKEDPDRFPLELQDVFTGSRLHSTLIRSEILQSVGWLRQALVGTEDKTVLCGMSSGQLDPAVLEPTLLYAALLFDATSRSNLFSRLEQEAILSTFLLTAIQLEDPNYLCLYAHDPERIARRDCAVTVASLVTDKHPQTGTRILNARRRTFDLLDAIAKGDGLSVQTGAVMAGLNAWAELARPLENANPIIPLASPPFAWPEFTNTLLGLCDLTLPPDKRYGGVRLLPTIGRSFAGDQQAFAVMGAALARPLPPETASQLAWVWRQAGSPMFEPFARHQLLYGIFDFQPPDVQGTPPTNTGSREIANFGALMRANFDRPDEGCVLFKCGPQPPYSLHHDQGEIIFYAFGAPLLVDPASPPAREATWSHNTVRIDSRTHNSPGRIVTFAPHDDDDYALGEIVIDSLSELKEYTRTELENMAAGDASFAWPAGTRPDFGQTTLMLPAPNTLTEPVVIRRHVLFNKARQYLIVLDRVTGTLATDVFFNAFADTAQVEGNTATFAGPFGVDLAVHAFGTGDVVASLTPDGSQRWTLRLSQAAPSAPAPESATAAEETGDEDVSEDDEPPPPPSVEYLTVLCPSRRALPGEANVVEHPAPQVEKLEGITGVRLTYGDTVRYVFLSENETEYDHDGVYFKGTRGSLTIRPTHFVATLDAAGKLLYQGKGLETTEGAVSCLIAPGGFAKGDVSGQPKRVTFHGFELGPSELSFRVDGMEFLGDGDEEAVQYGISYGNYMISVHPK